MFFSVLLFEYSWVIIVSPTVLTAPWSVISIKCVFISAPSNFNVLEVYFKYIESEHRLGLEFSRCLNNLIDNGIKYAEKVNIDLNKSNNNLFIKVEDNGPGIPEKEYDNVFKPFYKIDKGRADSKSSVGLGLSIASDIIRSHGGNIKLEKSKMNGLGVKIFLPI